MNSVIIPLTTLDFVGLGVPGNHVQGLHWPAWIIVVSASRGFGVNHILTSNQESDLLILLSYNR